MEAGNNEDELFAERLLKRFGTHAAVQAKLRVLELEELGESDAASQWRRALGLIETQLDDKTRQIN